MTGGITFDNILVGSNEADASEFAVKVECSP